jgi:hypothetical protein
MIDVADRANVAVRLVPLEFRLAHRRISVDQPDPVGCAVIWTAAGPTSV